MKKSRNNGITLIALIITIVVMLILVVVSVRIALDTGLFETAGNATKNWAEAQDKEQEFGSGKVTIGETTYNSIEEYIAKEETKQQYLGFIITTETKEVIYTDKDGNTKDLTEEVTDGDIIQYGDYEYRYNSKYEAWWDDTDVAYHYNWIDYPEQNGWGVIVRDNTKSEYGELCGTILGKQVNTMENTFRNCEELLEAPQIPNSVINMKETFWECRGLKEVPQIPSSVQNMDHTFYRCESLTNTSISENVTILYNSFYGCSNLVNVNIPDNIKALKGTFGECNALTSVQMTDSIEEIGEYCFSGCSNLTDITIPNTVKTIGRNAFYRCKSITNITIPEEVETIDVYTFQECNGLTNITIPASVKNIESKVFADCTGLTNITYTGTKAEWESITFGGNWNLNVPATTVQCSDGTVDI